MANVTFRKRGDDHPITWTVAQGNVMAVKIKDGQNLGKKFINYYKGENSVFTEDIKNKDLKPSNVPEFTYDYLTKRTQLTFDDSDVNLYNYLTTHPWFKKKYDIYSKDIEASAKLNAYEKIEKALGYIKESDDNKIRANAISIFGLHVFGKSAKECAADLKEKAIQKPDAIISAFEADDYQTKYLVSLAFCKGIIKNNPTSTAVVWNDKVEGVLVHVAQGENGIEKLTGILQNSTEESRLILQEFQSRMDKADKNISYSGANSGLTDQVLKEKDAEIEALRKQLAEANNTNQPATQSTDTIAPVVTTIVPDKPLEELTLEEAQGLYKAVLESDVPVRYKNDKEWLIEKIAAKQQNT